MIVDEWGDPEIEQCTSQEPCVYCRFFQSAMDPMGIFVRSFPDNCNENKAREEMRRYLYRNVACEYRKSFADFHQMPNPPGWA